MNIYAKLQACRVELQQMNIKKSGKNDFAKYDYYELGDFLPKINELMLGKNLTSNISFTNELATLTIIDTDKPEDTIVFTSPMSDASLKGCHNVQNLGATQSYLRRYLYMNAFEIVEHDALDATIGKEGSKEDKSHNTTGQTSNELISKAQANRIFALSGGNADICKTVLKSFGYEKSAEVQKKHYDEICKAVQELAADNL
jgi:hypothetical protein